MPVNANKSGSRLLSVIEEIARSQPIGVRNLARVLEIEKSAVQRAVTTLAEAGWIQSPAGAAGGWELTGRILNLAHMAHGSNSLRQRVRPLLNALRDETGETVYLAIPDVDGLVVTEVAESHQALRLVMPVGIVVSAKTSAPGRAILPHLEPAQQERLLGTPLSDECRLSLQKDAAAGYCVSRDKEDESAVSIAAPLLDNHGRAMGALVIYAVHARTLGPNEASYGALLLQKARELSSFGHSEFNIADLKRAIGSFG